MYANSFQPSATGYEVFDGLLVLPPTAPNTPATLLAAGAMTAVPSAGTENMLLAEFLTDPPSTASVVPAAQAVTSRTTTAQAEPVHGHVAVAAPCWLARYRTWSWWGAGGMYDGVVKVRLDYGLLGQG